MDGPDIMGRRLTDEEREQLEGEITGEELLESLNNSNFNSASGWDGISFKLIRKFWAFLGPFLLRSANESIREGELSSTFKMGMIKIIPKKGDCSKLGTGDRSPCYAVGIKLLVG